MSARDDLGRLAGTPPQLWREHDPLGEVRVGPDLVVTVCATAAATAAANGREMAGTQRLVAIASDNDGNYLTTLATVRGRMPDPMLAAAIDTARQLYPVHAGLIEYREVGAVVHDAMALAARTEGR